jgi:hypothetical protein
MRVAYFVCCLACFFRFPLEEKALKQRLQGNGRSPVCLRWWMIRLDLPWYEFVQPGQMQL